MCPSHKAHKDTFNESTYCYNPGNTQKYWAILLATVENPKAIIHRKSSVSYSFYLVIFVSITTQHPLVM